MSETREARIWVFFYGSYMNVDVLKEVDLVPSQWEVARAPGFDIQIAPRANLIRSDRDVVWGINVTATHAELVRLYLTRRPACIAASLPRSLAHRDVISGAGLWVVADLHQLAGAWIDESLAGFLPSATGRQAWSITPSLEEQGGDHDDAVDEQVEDEAYQHTGERERDRADDRQDAVDQDGFAQHQLTGWMTAAVP